MIQSLRDIIAKAVPAYYSTEFGDWIHQWPGQVTHTGRAINWTAQVMQVQSVSLREKSSGIELNLFLISLLIGNRRYTQYDLLE